MQETLTVQCCVSVYPKGTGLRFVRPRPCQSAAKVEREGRWFCGTHDPEKVKARRGAERARWAMEARVSQALWNVQRIERQILAAVRAGIPGTVLVSELALADEALTEARAGFKVLP